MLPAIDWRALAAALDDLARCSRPGALLSVGVALPGLPEGLPASGEWVVWQRPSERLRLRGIGWALTVETAGPGRFAALHAALDGLQGNRLHAGSTAASPAFAGFAFAAQGGTPFPNASLGVPAVLLRETPVGAAAVFSCAAEDAAGAIDRWRTLLGGLHIAARGQPTRLTRHPGPLAEQAFVTRARTALAAIRRGDFDKLVLTHAVRVGAAHPLDPAPVLATLAENFPDCAVFAAAREGNVLLGASPETLLRLRGRRAEVDALAGTAWPTQRAAQAGADEASWGQALATDKNRREHDCVATAVSAALAPLCESVTVPDHPEVLHLRNVRHLRRRIVGTLRAGVSALELVARLHPTPAVGGVPTAAALDWLAAHGDRRGAWYTGGFGWLDAAGDADLAVPLRCGLLSGAEATLYGGAGFVAGSDPQQEMAEIEAKLAAMLQALQARPDGAARRATGT